MKKMLRLVLVAGVVLMSAGTGNAELPWQYDEHTRFMVLGDSLGSGYGAIPQTNGYAYQLYQGGVVGNVASTLFCNASVIGVTSSDVLVNQVPQAFVFRPDIVTLTVGGNDLARIMEGADPGQVLSEFQNNLNNILYQLVVELGTTVYIANLYVIDRIPGADMVIPAFNQIVAGVAGSYGVAVADVYDEFQGRSGLLMIDKPGASPTEVHPTNAGHKAIANAFALVMQ